MTDADLVILGGGSGGYACAFRAASLSLTGKNTLMMVLSFVMMNQPLN